MVSSSSESLSQLWTSEPNGKRAAGQHRGSGVGSLGRRVRAWSCSVTALPLTVVLKLSSSNVLTEMRIVPA